MHIDDNERAHSTSLELVQVGLYNLDHGSELLVRELEELLQSRLVLSFLDVVDGSGDALSPLRLIDDDDALCAA
jgi:hypothetical protein